jgi:hypothetical protein
VVGACKEVKCFEMDWKSFLLPQRTDLLPLLEQYYSIPKVADPLLEVGLNYVLQ